MSGAGKRIIVVGGGVIGLACAHYLERAGHLVTLLDKGETGKGCSHANCGYVCPSHVLPLAGPGVIGRTLKEFLRPNSPFAIRLRLDARLWGWLYQFARRCNRRDMLAAGKGILALLNSSRALYDDLFGKEGLAAEWETRGLLFVFFTACGMEHYAATNALLTETFDMPGVPYGSKELEALEPALKPGLGGAWHYPRDAHLRPDRLMASWHSLLQSRGVDIREGQEFQGFVEGGSRVAKGVRTAQGELAGDTFVIATGAWTPLLESHLRCRMPIQPGKGYSITMPRPGHCPAYPMVLEEHRVAITPMQSGYRIGSTMEFAGYDETLRRSRLELLRRGARLYLHEPFAEPVLAEWWGWRPMVPDGMPIIGRVPAWDNVLVAAGHSMLGLSMAPATGKLVAELIGEEGPHVDPEPYRVTRF